jgi:hypothetical protein
MKTYVMNVLNHSKMMFGCRFGCSPVSNSQNPSSFAIEIQATAFVVAHFCEGLFTKLSIDHV